MRLLPFVVLGMLLGAAGGVVARTASIELAEARMAAKAQAFAASVERRLRAMETAMRGIATSPTLEGSGIPGPGWSPMTRAIIDHFGGWIALARLRQDGQASFGATTAEGAESGGDRAPVTHPSLSHAVARAVETAQSQLIDVTGPGGMPNRELVMILPLEAPRYGEALLYGFHAEELWIPLIESEIGEEVASLLAKGKLRITQKPEPHVNLTGTGEYPLSARPGGDTAETSGRGELTIDWAIELDRFSGWTVAVSRSSATLSSNTLGIVWGPLVAIAFVSGATLAVLYQERSAHARRRAAVEAGRQQIARLHEELPLVLFAVQMDADDTLTMRYVGGKIERVTGWPPEVLATPDDWEDRRSPETPDLPAFIRPLRTQSSISREWRMRQPNGSWAWMRTDASVSSRDGMALSAVGYVTNISRYHDARERATAAGRLASIGEMATGIAHELKQPLATIRLAMGNARNARARGDGDGVERRLRIVVEQARRAASTIDHLRQFGQHGTLEANALTAVPVRKAIDGALALVGAGLSDAGIAATVRINDPEPFILAQCLPVEQVLINLLLNAKDAIRSAPPGDHAVTLAASLVGDKVEVTVSDTGGGIPAQIMPHLLEPFVTTKTMDQGTGLGLSVSAGIVKAFGGTIAACNTERGALFTVTFPAAAPES